MKRILTIILIIISSIGFSQSEPQFTMFWNNYSMFNPANTSLNYKHYGNIVYRSYWDKIENAPTTFSAQYETNVKNNGIGFGYINNQKYYFSSNSFYLNYAYHSQKRIVGGRLSFGVSLVYEQLKFNPVNSICDGCDVILIPSYPIGSYQGTLNLNLGIIYKREELEIGISSTQINQVKYEVFNSQKIRHYFGYASYEFKLSNQFDLKPIVFIKANTYYVSTALSVMLTFDDKYWAGITYRYKDAVGFQLGIDVKEKYRIGYSYDFMTNKLLGQYGSGSHEITVGLLIK